MTARADTPRCDPPNRLTQKANTSIASRKIICTAMHKLRCGGHLHICGLRVTKQFRSKLTNPVRGGNDSSSNALMTKRKFRIVLCANRAHMTVIPYTHAVRGRRFDAIAFSRAFSCQPGNFC
jgi:hypothetical protein